MTGMDPERRIDSDRRRDTQIRSFADGTFGGAPFGYR